MKKILYILLTINIKLFPVIIGVNCFAQQIDADARVKSQFIYGFTKYIGWPDQQYFKDFSIGVLGSDSAIYAELEKMARIKKVQGRLIKVKQFNSVDEILKVQLLYVNKKHGFDIDKILKKTKGKSILLVSENYPFNSSMINFVQIDRFQKFELNETRMKAENFIISPILINQAITSSEDWQQLYKKTETKLETEKKIVKEQKKEISEMQEEHKRQQKIIEEANKEIAKKQQEIEEQKTELVTLMEENEVQQQKINEKVETLKEQEQAITIQKEEIEKQKRNMFFQNEVLVEQLEQVQKQQGKIEKQKKVLSNQLSELEKQRLIIYLSVAVLGLFAIFVFVAWRAYKIKRQANKQLAEKNKEIEAEKEKSDKLLLNILPQKTAEELKVYGKATARQYNLATVMFTDFQGFTKISAGMNAQDLVKELDRCFIKFDEIVEKHHIEKIKTIGDGYMCAGGVPIRNKSNPLLVTLAALEIRDFMQQLIEDKKAANEPFWELRLGIHTGSLTAGVVGKKKFAYDIWGDTVNTASRMESNGKVGKINVSESTYKLIKNYFNCTHRGKFEVKGKGEMEMYFVDGIKPEFSVNGAHTVPNETFRQLLSEM